jgi:hypothetical protein
MGNVAATWKLRSGDFCSIYGWDADQIGVGILQHKSTNALANRQVIYSINILRNVKTLIEF